MAFGSPDKFDGTSLYRDSSLYLQALIFRIGNTPHIIQYTIGEMAIKDAVQIVQEVKLAYKERSPEGKLVFLRRVAAFISNEEVIVSQLFDGKYININVKAELYKLLGSMRRQIDGWIGTVLKSQNPD